MKSNNQYTTNAAAAADADDDDDDDTRDFSYPLMSFGVLLIHFSLFLFLYTVPPYTPRISDWFSL